MENNEEKNRFLKQFVLLNAVWILYIAIIWVLGIVFTLKYFVVIVNWFSDGDGKINTGLFELIWAVLFVLAAVVTGVVIKQIYRRKRLICAKCGTENKGDNDFCSNCGKRISGFEKTI